MNKFINSVVFMRSYDYFGKDEPENADTLAKYISFFNRYDLPATYMPEYDCLVKPGYAETILNGKKSSDEVGLWFEVTGELCRDAGVPWRSKRNRDWDFYVCPGFIMSYDEEEKKKLIDTAMAKMKALFGSYPKCAGAWLLDSFTMDYMTETYGVSAYIICREQWGMDGYTPWGGPYFGGYYPSKNNMLTPASDMKNAVKAPVFRMYVSDPIYSYYEFSQGELTGIDYGLFTQEPTWRYGQSENWVKWIYETLFGEKRDAFSYFQLGQETGFGFRPELEAALTLQTEYALKNRERYGFEFVTVGEMGRRFMESYKKTPDSFTPSPYDWADKGNASVWFNNEHYRINVYGQGKTSFIRDIHLFDDSYTERFKDAPCRSEWAVYDNLPVVDGVRFTPGCDERNIPFDNRGEGRKYGEPAGLYLDAELTGTDKLTRTVFFDGGAIALACEEDGIRLTGKKPFTLRFSHAEKLPYLTGSDSAGYTFSHRGFAYRMEVTRGRADNDLIYADNNEIILKFHMMQNADK